METYNIIPQTVGASSKFSKQIVIFCEQSTNVVFLFNQINRFFTKTGCSIPFHLVQP